MEFTEDEPVLPELPIIPVPNDPSAPNESVNYPALLLELKSQVAELKLRVAALENMVD